MASGNTIEPRLIWPFHPELPPLKGLSLPSPSGRPHPPPLDASTGQWNDGADGNAGPMVPDGFPRGSSWVADESTVVRQETCIYSVPCSYESDRNSQLLSALDPRLMLDGPETGGEQTTKPSQQGKQDFVQLPQPLRKQKANSRPIVPPIIVGLQEPPSNQERSTRFPRISSGDFPDRRRPDTPRPLDPATSCGKIKKKATKPRRKWTEEETNYLLLGVKKHSVGKWTDILDDADYKFNDRSAGDLKDRFRTCCPDELRASKGAKSERKTGHQAATVSSQAEPIASVPSWVENILNEPEDLGSDQSPFAELSITQNDSDSAPNPPASAKTKPRKCRAHRKKMEDLIELGIEGPFRSSGRRSRRPFSEQEDRDIIAGFEKYGARWSKIRESSGNLASRLPTDLRDRLRNKYPEKIASAEKGVVGVKPGNLLEPSINMEIGNSLDRSKPGAFEAPLNRSTSKEDMASWPPSGLPIGSFDFLQPLSFSEGSESVMSSNGIGEMDISRFLLDDTQPGLFDDTSTGKRGPQ